MLRLVLEATAATGYIVGSVYHASDVLSLPIPIVGLVWLLSFRCVPPYVPSLVFFWGTYSLLVYQLVSFHDLNACLLDECSTSKLYSYITLASTCLFWFTTRAQKKEGKQASKITKEPALPALPLKIRVRAEKKSVPMRLNMGDSIQPKWV